MTGPRYQFVSRAITFTVFIKTKTKTNAPQIHSHVADKTSFRFYLKMETLSISQYVSIIIKVEPKND